MQLFREIRRVGTVRVDFVCCRAGRVEHLARRRDRTAPWSVSLVAHDRKPHVGECHANLVQEPRARIHVDQRRTVE